MSTFRFKAFSIPTIKLFKHHSSKYPAKMWIFHFEFDYYLNWTFNLSSHFLKPLKAIKTNFFHFLHYSIFFTSAKYLLYIGKKKKSHCQDGDRVKNCSEKLWSVILGNLLWLTLLWAESLDEMISRVLFHLQTFCDCLNFDSSNWIMIRNLCHVLQYIFFFLKNTACKNTTSFGTFAWKMIF